MYGMRPGLLNCPPAGIAMRRLILKPGTEPSGSAFAIFARLKAGFRIAMRTLLLLLAWN